MSHHRRLFIGLFVIATFLCSMFAVPALAQPLGIAPAQRVITAAPSCAISSGTASIFGTVAECSGGAL
jgi:hypothetical protein